MTPLSTLPQGTARVLAIEGDGPESVRLKRLGICEGSRVTIMQAGDPMILEVVGTRIGVSRQLASRVQVEPITESVEAERG